MANVIVDSNLPSIHKAFDFAWMTFKKQFGLFTAIMLTFLASWVILEVIVVAGQRFGFLLWAIAHLSFFFIFAGLEIGFIRICLASHDGKQIHYVDIFREFHLGISFLFAQLVYLVMVLVGFVTLIVPGLYLGAKYALYAFHFADGYSNLKQSFQESAVIGGGSWWFLFWFSVFIFLLNVLGASILGIGLIITVPLSGLMKASIYRQLIDNSRRATDIVPLG
jgi:hypothetical protein